MKSQPRSCRAGIATRSRSGSTQRATSYVPWMRLEFTHLRSSWHRRASNRWPSHYYIPTSILRTVSYTHLVRSVDGQITVLDEPNGNASPPSTSAVSINADGSITGVYLDAKNERHGFALLAAGSSSSPTSASPSSAASTTAASSVMSQPLSSSASQSPSGSGGGGSMSSLALLLLLAQVGATAAVSKRQWST